ncbi:MAG: hypothetical protein CM1200mP35_07590 [Chloroflexota bacterium]|nr:MAG: hypothetical protein CM1200mP35_07590 [Chloroflexota bacterium]
MMLDNILSSSGVYKIEMISIEIRCAGNTCTLHRGPIPPLRILNMFPNRTSPSILILARRLFRISVEKLAFIVG